MGRRSGRYGFDAPGVLVGLAGSGLACLVAGGFAYAFSPLLGLLLAIGGVGFSASAASFAYTTRRGKFEVWDRELDRLGLAGDERALDLGAGRGAVLTALARRLPAGRATGVDLWSRKDQSGNTYAVTRRNADAEGVGDRISIVTGDVRTLPFADGAFDVVVSGLVLHNIPDEAERAAAVSEAWRVLRPGGRLCIADIHHARAYADLLRRLQAEDVAVRSLGWRYWYGSPRLATWMVTARKPAQVHAPG